MDTEVRGTGSRTELTWSFPLFLKVNFGNQTGTMHSENDGTGITSSEHSNKKVLLSYTYTLWGCRPLRDRIGQITPTVLKNNNPNERGAILHLLRVPVSAEVRTRARARYMNGTRTRARYPYL